MPLFSRKPDPVQEAAHRLHHAITAQARQPGFFTGCGVPDTLDGRFELLALHAVLVLRRLRAERAVGQALFDLMFASIDQAAREAGIGDLGVGKRVKAMARALYGRIEAYGQALDRGEPLEPVLVRNLYGTVVPPAALPAVMAGYVRDTAESLKLQPESEILAGNLRFPAVPKSN